MFSYLESQLISLGRSDSLQRVLQDGANKSNSTQLYAFLVWYIFLVFCCAVPTFCAYRRRRVLEQRFAHQQANLYRLQQSSNLFLLSNLQHGSQIRRCNSERIQQERLRALTDELKGTTMVVKAENIETPPAIESSPLPSESDTLSAKDDSSVNESDDGAVSTMESGTTPDKNVIATTSLDDEIDYTDFTEDNGLVRLPPDAVNANRTVPGVCAICLGPYAEGEQVSWSPQVNCQHAFHTDCIIPWLAKKDEPKCPVCRQEFCAAAVVDEAAIGFDLQQREASFLESFSQALALSQIYRPYTVESGNAINLQLANLAIRNRTANAALEAGLHMASDPEPARNASQGQSSVEVNYGTDDTVAGTSGTARASR